MDEKRVNNTDPVVQVRLRVMVGNFHGALKKVCLAAGFVYPELSANYQYERGYMQHSQLSDESRHIPDDTRYTSEEVDVPGVIGVISFFILCIVGAVFFYFRSNLYF